MFGLRHGMGLSPQVSTPPLARCDPSEMITEEAALTPPHGTEPRVEVLVSEGDAVAQGAPLARLRDAPEVVFVAPMPARVAAIRLKPGHRLGELRLFSEPGGDRRDHKLKSGDARALMQSAGLWPLLRRRPFGGMPPAGETPHAIFVMACDTRPHAPDPRAALEGREAAFARGLDALTTLTGGPIFLCQSRGAPLAEEGAAAGRLRLAEVGPRHPQGLAGLQIHARLPATPERPVWDIHAEDVAALGALLESGLVPRTRLVSVSGPALSESRLLRCQPGADLRGLSYGAARGPHVLLTGSALDGHPAHWLGPRDRQVTALPQPKVRPRRHWFVEALTRSSLPRAVIPTAALEQAAGGGFPVAALIRALASGDDETATRLGALSLLEEDLALAEYALGGDPRLTGLLREMLDRTRAEAAA